MKLKALEDQSDFEKKATIAIDYKMAGEKHGRIARNEKMIYVSSAVYSLLKSDFKLMFKSLRLKSTNRIGGSHERESQMVSER